MYEVPVIIIGKGNLLTRYFEPGDNDVSSNLVPGQGWISVISPNDFFREGGLFISGVDETGLIAAANYVAGRMPSIWKLKGKSYEDVFDQISKFLEQREIEPDEINLSAIIIDSEKAGVAKLTVNVSFDNDEMFDRALDAFTGKDEKAEEDEERVELSGLEFSDLHKIEVKLSGPGKSDIVNLVPEKPWQTTRNTDKSNTQSPDFTLSQLYSIDGIFRDTNQDFVPDNVISYFSLNGVGAPRGIIDISSRVGLEAAGIRLPIARPGGEEEYPEQFGFPIIYGIEHYQVKKLLKDGELYGISKNQGEGFIQFAAKKFNDKNGLVISGSDKEGLKAISDYVAKRMPYLWDYGKGNFRLEDIETDVRRFFQIQGAPGQAVLAIYKLNEWLERIESKEIESVEVEIATKEIPEGLEDFAVNAVKNFFPSAEVAVSTYKTGFGKGDRIFEEEFDIPWEVDDFWTMFRIDALPEIHSGSKGKIVVRVSESPEVRSELKTRIEKELADKGLNGGAIEVVVLSAYKQGYSWLYDEVLPKISDKDVGRIEITYHTLKESKEIRWQTINSDTRWLQELYPVDAVLARDLGIPDSLITFTPTQKNEPIYSVKVLDTTGFVIFEEEFDPKYVVRPFFDLFPEYELVRVTTGWFTAEIDGKKIVDKRIKTDPEKFWDHLQQKTYRKIIDYVMDIQEGRPSSANAPYFDEFRIDLTLSEPNYRIGVDEEVISSTEALHEDIYFETLTLFNLIGGRYNAGSMNYPGRILPYIQPSQDGKPGKAKIVFTGKERARPQLIFTYKEAGREPEIKRYDLSNLRVDAPKLRGITVKSGMDGLSKLLFEVEATDSTDRYEEFKERSSESAIDRSFLSAEKLIEMVRILEEFHNEGMFENALSYDKVEGIDFRITLADSSDFSRMVSLPKSKNPKNTNNPRLYDSKFTYNGQQIVQWDTPIPPAENEKILARLNTFPNVNAYYMTTSFLGQDIYAVDFLPPTESKFVSQAKLNALKPTLFISGRQHANEVSSTSHILRLAELIATDPVYQEKLKNVNVVLHPITNPDGARLAYEMQKINPDFMLHAGYLGALGVDATSGSNSPDPIYPESKVRPRIRETWLPDIYINMHGYPSHEWVQYFAGYSAWVRSRNGGQRSWWAPRGWFIPGFRWVEDDKYPEIKTAQFAILDSIAVAITSIPEVDAMNRRMYARYRKYGVQDRENFTEYFHNGILVNVSIQGRKVTGQGVNNPRITYFSITTEAPDETA
ncbi:hypothetical protein IID62_08910, partial [candidate division KSB1 bacterium]|nr:hypothetical protein [candidate division KSB1 bacterium]